MQKPAKLLGLKLWKYTASPLLNSSAPNQTQGQPRSKEMGETGYASGRSGKDTAK